MKDAAIQTMSYTLDASQNRQDFLSYPNPIDLREIQGIVARGYGNLPAACYGLFHIKTPDLARPTLIELQSKLTYAEERPPLLAINLAWTYRGLRQMGLDENIADQFSNEFRSGIDTNHKRRILGDEGRNSPEFWDWGGPNSSPIDLLLLCYAVDQASLEHEYQNLKQTLAESGIEEVRRLDTQVLPDNKEHFGFRDGIAQPFLKEFDRKGRDLVAVPLGEILLGYPNGYDRYTQRPLIAAELDTASQLPPDPEGSPTRDLGKNGTYLVFRQMSQDIPAFWRYLQEQTSSSEEAVRLASKMVGRWPSGAPLVLSPEEDNTAIKDKDAFTYHDTDRQGFKCPLGAHIRRTHPRDSLQPEPGSEKSIAFSNRHRLLRRGRSYGAPFHPSVNPTEYLKQLSGTAYPEESPEKSSEDRGLHFICINANIGRQFEFVQHTWANNPNFNGLYQDPDPIIGSRSAYGLPQNRFTQQQPPVRCQFSGMPEFVGIRGGGYFFLPSRSALAFILSRGASA
ncbi:Dyp-type peroxidase [Hahella ganghwensis]|uniref:Dyp-type peroxidase n=1 Tax=Hahella ganghwensis TaxID=286420 RepID=UPI00037C9151|nr:Dyp-type peroxidase [Hahella ganghwensis]